MGAGRFASPGCGLAGWPAMSGHPVAATAGRRFVPPTRYRHPGDVTRLIAGPPCSLAVSAAAHRQLLGPAAPDPRPPVIGAAGVLTGIVQLACVAAAVLGGRHAPPPPVPAAGRAAPRGGGGRRDDSGVLVVAGRPVRRVGGGDAGICGRPGHRGRGLRQRSGHRSDRRGQHGQRRRRRRLPDPGRSAMASTGRQGQHVKTPGR
jgi:hypothetical protein